MNIFEFDHQKSESNLEKHGINFIDAQAIWQDIDFAKSEDEPRFLAIGQINNKHWSAIFTYRGETL